MMNGVQDIRFSQNRDYKQAIGVPTYDTGVMLTSTRTRLRDWGLELMAELGSLQLRVLGGGFAKEGYASGP